MCHSFASLKDRSEFAVGKRAFRKYGTTGPVIVNVVISR